jgi:hypothetical protein
MNVVSSQGIGNIPIMGKLIDAVPYQNHGRFVSHVLGVCHPSDLTHTSDVLIIHFSNLEDFYNLCFSNLDSWSFFSLIPS